MVCRWQLIHSSRPQHFDIHRPPRIFFTSSILSRQFPLVHPSLSVIVIIHYLFLILRAHLLPRQHFYTDIHAHHSISVTGDSHPHNTLLIIINTHLISSSSQVHRCHTRPAITPYPQSCPATAWSLASPPQIWKPSASRFSTVARIPKV